MKEATCQLTSTAADVKVFPVTESVSVSDCQTSPFSFIHPDMIIYGNSHRAKFQLSNLVGYSLGFGCRV